VQDAGVPLKREVAGVAMGLLLESDGSSTILTDILGLEDALGDMDFKVAGDGDSISAFQMDIKVEGIPFEVLRKALAAAKVARSHILLQMRDARPAPRRALSPHCRQMASIIIPAGKVGSVIGSGGVCLTAARAARFGVPARFLLSSPTTIATNQ
jgi:polyribonucleotide nucleotidyltransferase